MADNAGELFKRLGKSISVVTTRDGDTDVASVATAVCNISDAPPSLLLCVEQGASLARVLQPGDDFVLNLLSADDGAVLNAAASGSGAERFAAGDWYDLAGGGKALRSAQAVAACRAAQRLPWATHFIYIAEIQSVELAAQASTLVYFGGGFHPLAAD